MGTLTTAAARKEEMDTIHASVESSRSTQRRKRLYQLEVWTPSMAIAKPHIRSLNAGRQLKTNTVDSDFAPVPPLVAVAPADSVADQKNADQKVRLVQTKSFLQQREKKRASQVGGRSVKMPRQIGLLEPSMYGF